ncbi:MAG: Bro-N domain-containing protein [Treponema sp.]|jgi:prophage antirepressor-like protein|nr:Bro-N domain-containing protein [Treponema sp.]
MESTNKPGRENYQLVPFTFENHTVRTVVIENEPWFVAKDVCDTLGLTNHRKAVGDLPENEKGVTTGYTPGGKQKMLTVNEPGLYRLVFQSRKPEAEKFKTWVFTEVLPSIRRTGMFLPEGLTAMIRRTVTDAVAAMEREAVIKRGTLLSEDERRFIAAHAGYPVWRLAALTGRGETTVRRLVKTARPEQPSLFEEAAP